MYNTTPVPRILQSRVADRLHKCYFPPEESDDLSVQGSSPFRTQEGPLSSWERTVPSGWVWHCPPISLCSTC